MSSPNLGLPSQSQMESPKRPHSYHAKERDKHKATKVKSHTRPRRVSPLRPQSHENGDATQNNRLSVKKRLDGTGKSARFLPHFSPISRNSRQQ